MFEDSSGDQPAHESNTKAASSSTNCVELIVEDREISTEDLASAAKQLHADLENPSKLTRLRMWFSRLTYKPVLIVTFLATGVTFAGVLEMSGFGTWASLIRPPLEPYTQVVSTRLFEIIAGIVLPVSLWFLLHSGIMSLSGLYQPDPTSDSWIRMRLIPTAQGQSVLLQTDEASFDNVVRRLRNTYSGEVQLRSVDPDQFSLRAVDEYENADKDIFSIEFQFDESRAGDCLIPGTPTREMLEGESDRGLLLDELCAVGDNFNGQLIFETVVTARAQTRSDTLHDRIHMKMHTNWLRRPIAWLYGPNKKVDTDELNKADQDRIDGLEQTNDKYQFAINMRACLIGAAPEEARRTRNQIRELVGNVLPRQVDVRARSGRTGTWNPFKSRRARRTYRRLGRFPEDPHFVYDPRYSWAALLSRPRRTYSADPTEICNFLIRGGHGMQHSVPRSQSSTGGPPSPHREEITSPRSTDEVASDLSLDADESTSANDYATDGGGT